MFTDYINRGIIKAGSPTKLASIIGKDYKDIWKYRNGKHLPEVTTCYKLAIYLDIEPSEIVACVEIEKSKSEENKEFWQSFLSQLKQGTTLVVLLTSLGLTGHVDTVSAGETSYNSEHKASLYEVMNR